MFSLYWEVYVWMELIVNLRDEDLRWFSGKRTFIDGSVYMRFSGRVGSRITSSVFMWFCIFWCRCVIGKVEGCGHQMFLLVPEVSKDSEAHERL